ncbi:hypothetical protein JCM5350_001306 [Sporobolomyces pararoseus]
MSSTTDSITLSTSDNPPILFKVSRAALVTHSKVFADMLSLPLESDDKDTTIPISETAKEVELFVAWIRGDEEKAKQLSEKLKEEGWEALAKLGDKYDSWLVRSMIEKKAWQVGALTDSAAFAFNLATLSGNLDLIKYTARRAVTITNLETSPRLRMDKHWRTQLLAWRKMQMARCFEIIRDDRKEPYCWTGMATCSQEGSRTWKAVVYKAFCSLDVRLSPPIKLESVLVFETPSNLCSRCMTQLQERTIALQQKLSQWVDFPLEGVSAKWISQTLKSG